MNTINKEHLEAWLFAQPRERMFRYTDSSDCLLCKFLRETTSLDVLSCNPCRVLLRDHITEIAIPPWLDSYDGTGFLNTGEIVTTMGRIQDEWIKALGPISSTCAEDGLIAESHKNSKQTGACTHNNRKT